MTPVRPLAVLMLLHSAALHAQSMDYGSLEALFGEPVTTSVTGSPQRASAVPATLEIITAEDIRRSGAVHLAGVLRQVSGIDVLQWTASHSDVAVRGYNKAFNPRLLVLVNGRQIYADHYGYVPWAALPVELAEIRQIEVVKGPNSALFGFNAVAGVINIITFNPDSDHVGFVTGRVGSQDHAELSAATTLRANDRLALRVSAGWRESDDFDTPVGPANSGVRRGDERKSLRFDLHYQATSFLELELEGSSTQLQQAAMSPALSLAWEDLRFNSIKLGLYADTGYGLSQLQLYHNHIDNVVYATSFDITDGTYTLNQEPLIRFDNDVTILNAQHIFRPATAHTLRVGGEYRKSTLPTTPIEGAEVSYDVVALSGMWEWRLTDALTFTMAAREDQLRLKRRGTFPAGLDLSNAAWDINLHANSYNAALLWQVDARNVLRLNAGRGVQLPSLTNLGGLLFAFEVPPEVQPSGTAFTTGLPTLQPTIVEAVELSWEHKLEVAPIDLRISAFRNDSSRVLADGGYSDFLAAIFNAPANIGDSRTHGAELALKTETDSGFEWSMGYLYQDIDDTFGAEFPDWLTFTNFEDTTARHLFNAGLYFTRGPWESDVFVYYKSDFGGLRVDEGFVFDPANPAAVPEVLAPVDDYVTVDLHLGYRFSEQLRFDLQARNLLDSPQTQTSGPRVERRVLGSVTYSF